MLFQFYKIQIHKRDANLEGADFSKEISDFKSYFSGTKINAYIVGVRPKDPPTLYENRIYRDQLTGDLVLMQLCSNKKVSKTINFQKVKEDTHPFCNLLFDLRPDSMLLAIEKSGAFNREPDAVRDLVEEFFKNLIAPQSGYWVTFGNMVRPIDFWEFVEERKRKNDEIRKIEFDFPSEKKDNIKGDDDIVAFLRYSRSLGQAFNAAMQQWVYESSTSLRLQQTNEDVRRLVDFFLYNAYDITIHFKDRGVCRSTKDVNKPIFKLFTENFIDEFISGQATMDEATGVSTYNILLWIDRRKPELEDYGTEEA
ncbi:MAG: hypothetical protein IKH58_09875 [Bacteroidales bacterium]|nr:hypothetical protein [Bacteroidales bacterium]